MLSLNFSWYEYVYDLPGHAEYMSSWGPTDIMFQKLLFLNVLPSEMLPYHVWEIIRQSILTLLSLVVELLVLGML